VLPVAELTAGQWPKARVTARMVEVAARHNPFRLLCLPRSLALWWLLRRQGIGSDLRIGVTPNESGLEKHAWVEYNGVALNDQDDVNERFAPFYTAITPKRSPKTRRDRNSYVCGIISVNGGSWEDLPCHFTLLP
jgi:hypothetical protein